MPNACTNPVRWKKIRDFFLTILEIFSQDWCKKALSHVWASVQNECSTLSSYSIVPGAGIATPASYK